jgi:pimeloyl-ACP methyl ester carboxylesterase
MSPTRQGLGVELAYEERGAGGPVLLVHGLADGAAGWRDVVGALQGEARVIAYDRRGYGDSDAPEPYERTTVEEQAEDAAILLRGLDAAPAVVCGRDLGAVVALDLVRRYRELVRAVALVDPALYQLVPDATEALSAERVVLEQALRDGGPAAAVDAWLTARGAPAERIERARDDHVAFFADYAGLATWPVLRRDLRGLAVPIAILISASSPPYASETARSLAELVGVESRDEAELVTTLRELIGVRPL